MRATEQELEDAVDKLHQALLEMLRADRAEDDAKIRKTKAHYNLQKAKDVVYGLELRK